MSAFEEIMAKLDDTKFADLKRVMQKLYDNDSETADYMMSRLEFLMPEREDD